MIKFPCKQHQPSHTPKSKCPHILAQNIEINYRIKEINIKFKNDWTCKPVVENGSEPFSCTQNTVAHWNLYVKVSRFNNSGRKTVKYCVSFHINKNKKTSLLCWDTDHSIHYLYSVCNRKVSEEHKPPYTPIIIIRINFTL